MEWLYILEDTDRRERELEIEREMARSEHDEILEQELRELRDGRSRRD